MENGLQPQWAISYRVAGQRRTSPGPAHRYGAPMTDKAKNEAGAASPKKPGSDPIYKRLYAFPEMVADLLRSLLPAEDLDIDAASLTKLPAEYVSDDFRQRRGDTVWRAHTRGGDLHVLVLLEFQSTNDATMALRVLEYTALLYGELVREDALGPDGLLPPVLPVVLYNGATPWRSSTQVRDLVAPTGPALAAFQPSQLHLALDERRTLADSVYFGELTRAVLELEQSRTTADLARVAESLAAGTHRPELKATFADWLQVLLRRMDGIPASEAEADLGGASLEEVRMTLADRVAEWPKPYIQQGREEGMSLGREEGMSLGREEGMSLGREKGREEGIAQQRMMLRRQAAARFGSATADRLARAIAAEGDPAQLSKVGEAVVRCATGDELLRAAGVST